MRHRQTSEPLWTRVAAGVAALAVISVMGRLLWQQPLPVGGNGREQRIQLRWLVPELPQVASVSPMTPPHQQPSAAALRLPTVPSPALPPSAIAPPAPPATAVPEATPPSARTQVNWSARLYGKDGGVDVSKAVPTDAQQKSNAERVFEHRDELATGVGERATADLFNRRPAGTRQSRVDQLLYGKDIQDAHARRPPEVAFNPALHERPSDLGSEATGDAYKAAPIRFERVPDLKGEASRRIRLAVGELERRYPRCSVQQRNSWMAPVLSNLDALQRVEYRFNNGADPVEKENTLPSAADSAYDLARRALWDAERRMKTCS